MINGAGVFAKEPDPGRCSPVVAEQACPLVAAHGGDHGGPRASGSYMVAWSRRSVGCQVCIHGLLCLCGSAPLLGPLDTQVAFRLPWRSSKSYNGMVPPSEVVVSCTSLTGFASSTMLAGFVIHLSSGVASFTAAYLGRGRVPVAGTTGFDGGSPFVVGRTISFGILNTHICTASILLVWVSLDMIFYQKSSVIGTFQGMITGLVCITPGAGLVESGVAALMGMLYTMMVLHRRYVFFQKVDDTLTTFHTHDVAGLLGGLLSGEFAKPRLLEMMYGGIKYNPELLYSILDHRPRDRLRQLGYQLIGALLCGMRYSPASYAS
ncbi:hypothetical protein MLD38_007847 [Melastoma candidum]|uniref:Uncharacterized protein n=1 Tax=Melastoma candidum TaxID=119954 RepID=A0ACB9RS18_9MYRT|nr:hypothetical protein MLD38_007847 [Melastoma candidum]